VLLPMKGWMQAESVLMNLSALGLAILLAMLVTGLLGWAFERIIIRPVYGQHLKQILITMGGMIVAEQLIHVIWGPSRFRCNCRPRSAGVHHRRRRARKIPSDRRRRRADGLRRDVPRAQSDQGRPADPRRRRERRDGRSAGLPHPRLFVGVFMAGSALAGLGGVMWGCTRKR
jgi:branched-chain amino acid transport system permease protein